MHKYSVCSSQLSTPNCRISILIFQFSSLDTFELSIMYLTTLIFQLSQVDSQLPTDYTTII